MTTHFLFGEDAVEAFNIGMYNDDKDYISGVDAVLYGDNNNLFNYETFEFIDGKTKPTALLSRYAVWGDWVVISKEEYDEL